MNNFTKYICAGLAIALLIIQAIMIWGLYGNFSGSLNELSDCTRKQLPQLIDLFTTMIVTNWVIIAALLFTLFAHHIVNGGGVLHALLPPRKAGGFVRGPVIQGVAP